MLKTTYITLSFINNSIRYFALKYKRSNNFFGFTAVE